MNNLDILTIKMKDIDFNKVNKLKKEYDLIVVTDIKGKLTKKRKHKIFHDLYLSIKNHYYVNQLPIYIKSKNITTKLDLSDFDEMELLATAPRKFVYKNESLTGTINFNKSEEIDIIYKKGNNNG